jgi:hypothetical protein
MPYKDLDKRKEYHAQYIKKWDKENVEKRRLYTRRHDAKREGTPERKAMHSSVAYRRHHRTKLGVLKQYGMKCVYCGEDHYEFLCIDHINDDGRAHRDTPEYKKYARGGMFGYLSKTEYRPDLYQVLCHNCNAAKQYYGIKPGGNKFKSIEEWERLSGKRNGKK